MADKESDAPVPALPKKRQRTARRILLAALLLPFLLTGMLIGAVLALNTGPGRDLAERLVNDLLDGRCVDFHGRFLGKIG